MRGTNCFYNTTPMTQFWLLIEILNILINTIIIKNYGKQLRLSANKKMIMRLTSDFSFYMPTCYLITYMHCTLINERGQLC